MEMPYTWAALSNVVVYVVAPVAVVMLCITDCIVAGTVTVVPSSQITNNNLLLLISSLIVVDLVNGEDIFLKIVKQKNS
jgi:hypothetical protein